MEQEKCINDKYMGWTKVTKAIIPPQHQQQPTTTTSKLYSYNNGPADSE